MSIKPHPYKMYHSGNRQICSYKTLEKAMAAAEQHVLRNGDNDGARIVKGTGLDLEMWGFSLNRGWEKLCPSTTAKEGTNG